MPQDRIYTEEEIGRVLKRAAEIQGRQPRSTGYGLSLEEIKDLAADAGIDPALVVAAASELSANQEGLKKAWWGGPMTTTRVRSVEGPISDATWEDMLTVLRRKTRDIGTTERRGTTRQWTVKSDGGRKGHLIATYRDGRTELELQYGNDALAVPGLVFPLVFGMIALPIVFEGLNLSGMPAFLVWSLIALVLAFIGRTFTSMLADRQYVVTADLMDSLTAVAHRASRKKSGSRHPVEQEPADESASVRQQGPYLQIPDEEFTAESDQSARTRERN